MSKILALDIGGANLKAAHSSGAIQSRPLAVWRNPAVLDAAIGSLLRRMPGFDLLAVTMTAELCDCFETKAHGVIHTLDAVEAATRLHDWAGPICVWLTDGRLVPPTVARSEPLKAAASNWLALAEWTGRFCRKGPALLIDVGSTTCDIIPLRGGLPVPRGRADLERLSTGELVYCGVRRTPVFALVQALELRAQICRVAAELFATTRDVYLWLGDLPEQPDDHDTADGRPATKDSAGYRLARVVCADRTMLTDAEIDSIARQVASAQLNELHQARRLVESALGGQPQTILVAGSGEFLARRVAERIGKDTTEAASPRLISLSEQFGPEISSAACAYALATLAAERWTRES